MPRRNIFVDPIPGPPPWRNIQTVDSVNFDVIDLSRLRAAAENMTKMYRHFTQIEPGDRAARSCSKGGGGSFVRIILPNSPSGQDDDRIAAISLSAFCVLCKALHLINTFQRRHRSQLEVHSPHLS
ncbi:hypothetical protein SERLADRAFT_442489 [Serpula lacrymans var. lacrymans S7.9]|uniref:Uncharacterized protein n=1 Tax=Serpula lacrymans var. lacrymans (strain S7.9) TaxID=578457 RepID=F8P9M8_SERL9|nr:uncharacterized protein SERLADRAFT_442489 [Serpula lacrymans var. lacrymans S7.9]EGO20357.1 hypothetical protein SERLADRAFT_442489 [Serpula lacrymans var. lacrymans S7.9]